MAAISGGGGWQPTSTVIDVTTCGARRRTPSRSSPGGPVIEVLPRVTDAALGDGVAVLHKSLIVDSTESCKVDPGASRCTVTVPFVGSPSNVVRHGKADDVRELQVLAVSRQHELGGFHRWLHRTLTLIFAFTKALLKLALGNFILLFYGKFGPLVTKFPPPPFLKLSWASCDIFHRE